MANKCRSCGKYISASSDVVKCNQCGLHFHKTCAGVGTADARSFTKWHCKNCKNTGTKKNTPESCSSGSPDADLDLHPDARTAISCDLNLAEEIKLIRLQLSSIQNDTASCRQEMNTFRQEVLKLNTTMAEFNNRINMVEEKLNNVTKRLTAAEKHISVATGTDIATQIQFSLNERDQESYSSDLEIAGVEEGPNENPTHLLTVIAQKIGVALEERDIVSAERKGKRRGAIGSSAGGDTGPLGPRTLVVRLARRSLRDQLLRAARTRRGADTSDIVPNAPVRRFYINERLTWINRGLFRKVREEARSKNWKFVWTRNGRVYARQSSESSAYRIRSDLDIDKIFKDK